MARRFVFLGNCQMTALCALYERFAAGITHDEATFLPSWTDLDSKGQETLASADVLVEQVQSFAPHLDIAGLAPSVRRIPVPLVAATFLWPFAGGAHPANAPTPFLPEGPFPGEVGDSFLARMILEGVPPERALAQYREHDLGGPAGLDRRLEIILDQQRRRDEVTGFSIAPLIERHFRTEHLFLSPHHPGLRISLALATQLFARLDAPARSVELLASRLKKAPFPPDELPIHPRVAEHFQLEFVTRGKTYEWRGEGRFTWDEWVLRYLRYTWMAEAFEAWSIATSKPAQARDMLRPLLAANPDVPVAQAAMAKALLALRDLEQAGIHAAEAVRLAPEMGEYHRVAAMISAARRQFPQAEAYARDAALWDAGDVGCLQLLAKVQEDMRNFPAAEATRRAVLEFRPDDATLLSDLGTVLLHQKRYDEALEKYQQALSHVPSHAGAHFGTSLALSHLARTEEAIAAVDRAIQHRPNVGAYYSHRGHLLQRIGQHDEAVAAFKAALEQDPDNAGLHNLLAELLLKDQMALDGLYHAQRAAECEPGSLRYQTRLAALLIRHSRLVEAIAVYRRLIEIQPAQTNLHAELAALYIRLDRLDEAVEVCAAAVKANETDAGPAADMAGVLLRMGRLTEALASIQVALERKPDQPAYAALQAEIAEAISGARFTPVPARYLATDSEALLPEMEQVMPACIRYTNFPDVNPSFGAHHVDNLYVEKPRWMPAVSLCRLPAGTQISVPNGEEFIAAFGDRIVAEQIRQTWSTQEIAGVMRECTKHETIDEPSVLIGRYGIRTWGHWLGELLPKVVAVEARWPGRFKYIVPDRFATDPVHTTAVQSLAYYGIGMDRLRLVGPKTQFDCANLYYVTSAWSAERLMHPMIAGLMREEGFREREPAQGWLNVALLRRTTRTRKIANLPAVERMLVERGFTIVDIEGLNFRQQVDLFRNASAIVGILGSGLTGLFYAPRGVKVLTVAPSEWGDLFFYAMMQERDAAFADIRGPTLASHRDEMPISEFIVPMEAFDKGLTAIGFPGSSGSSWVAAETRELAATA